MAVQLSLLDAPAAAEALPESFVYRGDVVPEAEAAVLIARFAELPFKEFEFHGYLGKRRVVSFGLRYDFADRAVHMVEPIPEFLLPLRERVAGFAGLAPDALEHALVTEYAPGAAIGWHRDRPVFGDVIGISFASSCRFRFRRPASSPSMGEGRGGGEPTASRRRPNHPLPNPPPSGGRAFERRSLILEPRSAYLMRGAAREEWEHSIPPAEALRYSVTFRTMRTR
jgi:alkylated DNA repair dioxygenase AlkB